MLDYPRLTYHQAWVMLAIAMWTDRRGYPPTLRELAVELGVCPSVAHGHLMLLRRAGVVAWEEHRPRTLRVDWGGW